MEEGHAGDEASEDPREVALPEVPETRPHHRGAEDRTMQVIAVLLTTFLLGLPVATAAVVLAAGPELVPDVPGGEVRLQVTNKCGTMFAEISSTGCFDRVNLTVRYPSGSEGPRAMGSSTPFGWNEVIELTEARATLLVDTEQGTWTREVWILEGRSHQILIDPERPRETSGIEGREVGGAVLLGMGAALGIFLIVAAIVWWVTGSVAAAATVRGLLMLWLAIVVVLVVVSLFLHALGIGLAVFGLWLWYLGKVTGGWIKRAEAAG